MSVLIKKTCYWVIKASGENTGLSANKAQQRGLVHHFVATNRPYATIVEAARVAAELSKETPGNRYYIARAVAGYLTHEPVVETW